MAKLFVLAFRNLTRYKRRSFLTGLLIATGLAAVIVFGGVSGSFKRMMIGEVTDSMLSHLQVHRRGYVSSIDSLPLTMNLSKRAYDNLAGILSKDPEVAAVSPRLKLGAMVSNYQVTTTARLNGIDPAKEAQAVPGLAGRIKNGQARELSLKKGEVLLPEVIARGLDLKKGDEVVVVATNKQGSVNGLSLKVAGVVESAQGPGGRDGYMHMDDATALLRLEEPEVSEVAVRVKDFDRLEEVAARLRDQVSKFSTPKKQPVFELHTWDQLSPFASFARMIDLMTIFIKTMLVGVVLVSVLNVMMMSVYERIREIGTLAAIGTTPVRISGLFLTEGFSLGLVSSLAGVGLGAGVIGALNVMGVHVLFGQGRDILVNPSVDLAGLLIPFAIVLAVSVLASLQPALKAARMEPVTALRHI